MELLLVHYSDPHIGGTLKGKGFIPKATGHDQGALEAFSDALGRIRRRSATARGMVHSGDASARGAASQLDLYKTLRDSGAVLGLLRLPRFRAGFNHLIDIPGNHDLWNGILFNLNGAARVVHWPPGPQWLQRIQLRHFEIVLHGICSTTGASSRQQAFAVGDFAPLDLADLEGQITATSRKPAMEQVHVIVTHHSPSVGNGLLHGLSSNAANALRSICQKHKVAVVLTGHDHTFAVTAATSFPAVEVRCSTTLQHNVRGQNQIRQFWTHSIQDDGTRLTWSATPWLYENRRFRELAARPVYSR